MRIAAVFVLCALAGCAHRSPPPLPSLPSPTPAEKRERDRVSNMLLAEWTDCVMAAARKMALTDSPAPRIANAAFHACDNQRSMWVTAQGAGIRSAAEAVASSSELTILPIVLDYVGRLRASATR